MREREGEERAAAANRRLPAVEAAGVRGCERRCSQRLVRTDGPQVRCPCTQLSASSLCAAPAQPPLNPHSPSPPARLSLPGTACCAGTTACWAGSTWRHPMWRANPVSSVLGCAGLCKTRAELRCAAAVLPPAKTLTPSTPQTPPPFLHSLHGVLPAASGGAAAPRRLPLAARRIGGWDGCQSHAAAGHRGRCGRRGEHRGGEEAVRARAARHADRWHPVRLGHEPCAPPLPAQHAQHRRPISRPLFSPTLSTPADSIELAPEVLAAARRSFGLQPELHGGRAMAGDALVHVPALAAQGQRYDYVLHDVFRWVLGRMARRLNSWDPRSRQAMRIYWMLPRSSPAHVQRRRRPRRPHDLGVLPQPGPAAGPGGRAGGELLWGERPQPQGGLVPPAHRLRLGCACRICCCAVNQSMLILFSCCCCRRPRRCCCCRRRRRCCCCACGRHTLLVPVSLNTQHAGRQSRPLPKLRCSSRTARRLRPEPCTFRAPPPRPPPAVRAFSDVEQSRTRNHVLFASTGTDLGAANLTAAYAAAAAAQAAAQAAGRPELYDPLQVWVGVEISGTSRLQCVA